MKTISIRQPWATLLVVGEKDIENRSRFFKHRGPLLVHASASPDRSALREVIAELGDGVTEADFPLGAIVGMVNIKDCVTSHPSEWFTGPFGLVCTDAKEFADPIPAKGKLGLWDYEWPR